MSNPTVAQQVLEEWGAKVEALPTSTKEESDWLATIDGCRVLIEEKSKLDNPESVNALNASLQSGEPHTTIIPLVRSNRLSGIVKKAVSQLDSTGSNLVHDFRILWLTAIGSDAEAKYHQLHATLFGSTHIVEIERNRIRLCYFFRQSDFYRFRSSIDGAITAFIWGDQITLSLCLNPYSIKYEDLRSSPFAHRLSDAVIDPIAEDQTGVAMFADTELDRSDSAQVLQYLSTKYQSGRLTTMDMNLASAIFRVPNHEH